LYGGIDNAEFVREAKIWGGAYCVVLLGFVGTRGGKRRGYALVWVTVGGAIVTVTVDTLRTVVVDDTLVVIVFVGVATMIVVGATPIQEQALEYRAALLHVDA
jgi:hypothetical protein